MRRLALIAILLIAALPAVATARPPAAPMAGEGTPVVTMRPAISPSASGFAVPRAGYGVIFATRTPGSGHGMVVAETDRLAAFRIAELRCSRGGPGCRLLAEFSETCGAVAQGERRAAITSVHAGAGPDRGEAEADALAECRARDQGASCRIVATQCGNRNG
jgi:hypothetical protein